MTALQWPCTLFETKKRMFGSKPFMTNMEATVDIVGVSNETKK